MAITDNQKIDYLFKKIGYGASKTDTNANKLAPNEAIPSPLLIRGDRVWQQSGDIPAVKPSSTSSIVQVYGGANVVECTEDNTATANRTWKTGLTGWIPPQFGSTYIVSVYIHTSDDADNAAVIGNKVFVTGSGNSDEWFFDYESGLVNFIGTNLPNGKSFTGKSVYIEGARYVGTYGVGSSDADIGDLSITGTTIATVDSNANIVLDPNGTGIVDIDTTLAMQLPKGTTAQRPGSPAAGYLRYNTTNNNVETYNGSAWVIVGDPDTSTVHVDSFSGDGATTGFTMGGSASTNQLIVTLNGVVQKPTEVYSASGTTLTFTTAPATGDDISIRRFVATVDNSIVLDNDGDTKIQVEESADEDTIRFDAAGTEVMTMTGTVTTAKTPVQFASYTTSARNGLSGVNGMVIYNSTTGKFQGYAGGSWVDLH
jgi:hypothetical protein